MDLEAKSRRMSVNQNWSTPSLEKPNSLNLCVVIWFPLHKEPDLAAIAQKEMENHTKAEERYREALKELKSQKLKDHEKQTQWAAP